jgi:3-dehydroquinate synthase
MKILHSSALIQENSFSKIDELFPSLASYSQFILLTHPLLKNLYGQTVMRSLQQFNRPIIEISIPKGEASKNFSQVADCWEQMFTYGIDRHSLLIALGGGVICDIAGFIASCYMRGIDTFYLPTTFMAMIDAAIGGKTGVNGKNGKNIIGSYHFPKYILIDPSTLHTLSLCEFRSGFAELIKYAMVGDVALFEQLEGETEKFYPYTPHFPVEFIQRCINQKTKFIEHDLYDTKGARVLLNYGHTFGHAIEAFTQYSYLHGEALSIGMNCAAKMSLWMGLCDKSVVQRQKKLCQRVDLPVERVNMPIKELLKWMRKDKKNIYGKINLILPERIGKVVQVPTTDSLIQDALSP